MSPIALVRMILLFGELRDCDSLNSYLTHPPPLRTVWVLLAYLITKLATCGWRATDQQGNVLYVCFLLEPAVVATHTPSLVCVQCSPMSACRRAMLTPVRWLLRVCLFTMGVYWIEESYPRGW